jgi:hypothetical protein
MPTSRRRFTQGVAHLLQGLSSQQQVQRLCSFFKSSNQRKHLLSEVIRQSPYARRALRALHYRQVEAHAHNPDRVLLNFLSCGAPLSKYRRILNMVQAPPGTPLPDNMLVPRLLPSRESFEALYRQRAALLAPVRTCTRGGIAVATIDPSWWLHSVVTHPFWSTQLPARGRITVLLRGDAYPCAGAMLSQLCCTVLDLGWWARERLATWPLALADCGDTRVADLRCAFGGLTPTFQRWIDLGTDPLLPNHTIRLILAGDEKFLRTVLGMPSLWLLFMQVYLLRGCSSLCIPRLDGSAVLIPLWLLHRGGPHLGTYSS